MGKVPWLLETSPFHLACHFTSSGGVGFPRAVGELAAEFHAQRDSELGEDMVMASLMPIGAASDTFL